MENADMVDNLLPHLKEMSFILNLYDGNIFIPKFAGVSIFKKTVKYTFARCEI